MALKRIKEHMLGFRNGFNSETFTATANQTLFTLTNGSYQIGKNRLEVYIQGAKQAAGAFSETSENSFTLSEGVPVGTLVEAKWYETIIPAVGGHNQSHLKGGADAIDITQLQNYKEQVSDKFTSVDTQLAEKAKEGVNVERFPLISPEVDDMPRIQRAIDDAISKGIRNVIFPYKDYICSSNTQVVITGSNISLISPKANVIVRDGSGARTFIIRESTDIHVEGLVFKSEVTVSTEAHNGLDIQNSSRVTVMNCKFKDLSFYGLSITQNTATSVNGACNDIKVLFCEFDNIGTHALEQFPKVLSKNSLIMGNTFKNCGFNPLSGVSGVAAKIGQATESTLFIGNTFEKCQTAIGVLNWESIIVQGNTIIDCEAFAIGITLSVHQLYTASFKSALITDNMLTYTTGFTPTSSYQAIDVNGGNTNIGLLSIEKNIVKGWSKGYEVRLTSDSPNIKIENNKFIDLKGSSLMDNTKGGIPNGISFKNNYFENNNNTLNIKATVDGKNANIEGNTFVRYGDYSIEVRNDATISRNRFIEPVFNGTAGRGCINGVGGIKLKLLNNFIDNATNGKAEFLVFASSATEIIEEGTLSMQQSIKIPQGSTTVIKKEIASYDSKAGMRTFYASAIPTTGLYAVGDKVINTAPTAGGYLGWICVTAGIPGTWKGYGAIQA